MFKMYFYCLETVYNALSVQCMQLIAVFCTLINVCVYTYIVSLYCLIILSAYIVSRVGGYISCHACNVG